MDDHSKGLLLAISSSAFIGASFIIKKKGLRKAGATGVRAGQGGFSYLAEPLWWTGMGSMIVGEVANFAAYAFAPAVLVTPLGALSIILSAILADILLNERLHSLGWMGCMLCVVGSTVIVLNAPEEREMNSVREIWNLAMQPSFLLYAFSVLVLVLYLALFISPKFGSTNILVYIGICSLMGSITVMSCKAVGIALKLTLLHGQNQILYPETLAFALIVTTCCLIQISYLNRALDTFNTAVVSPIYYVMFTSLTILASAIMFKDWDTQSSKQIVLCLCGFCTILCGTFLLHATKDFSPLSPSLSPSLLLPSSLSSPSSSTLASSQGIALGLKGAIGEREREKEMERVALLNGEKGGKEGTMERARDGLMASSLLPPLSKVGSSSSSPSSSASPSVVLHLSSSSSSSLSPSPLHLHHHHHHGDGSPMRRSGMMNVNSGNSASSLQFGSAAE